MLVLPLSPTAKSFLPPCPSAHTSAVATAGRFWYDRMSSRTLVGLLMHSDGYTSASDCSTVK